MIAFTVKTEHFPANRTNQVTFLGDADRRRILLRIGQEFSYMTRMNFGPSGPYRPNDWNKLSKRYARRVGRQFATLDLHGDLFRSIRMTVNGSQSVDLFSEGVEYADAHQYGNKRNKLPARPYFPVTPTGQLTELAERQIVRVANEELEKIVAAKDSLLQ